MLFICLFMPAFFSVAVSNKINNEKVNGYSFILKYSCYTFIIAIIMNILFSIFEEKTWFYQNEIFTYNFCMKYMIISLMLALILPYLYKVVSSTFKINIEVKKKAKDKKEAKNEKNSKKKS